MGIEKFMSSTHEPINKYKYKVANPEAQLLTQDCPNRSEGLIFMAAEMCILEKTLKIGEKIRRLH